MDRAAAMYARRLAEGEGFSPDSRRLPADPQPTNCRRAALAFAPCGKLTAVAKPTVISIVKDPNSTYSMLFEDDGKVAYAYLRDGTRIVSDAWVYNCGDAPETPDWTLPDARSRLPFTNPASFVRDEPRPIVDHPSDISAHWVYSNGEFVAADVLIHGTRFARLQPGARPGWARLSSRDGPNAKVLADR
jgi:hypothetical protein